jgi:hypothetical protein
MENLEAAIIAAQEAETGLEERIYGLSVECFVVPTIDDALRASRRPHRRVRHSTACQIRAAGLEVLPTRDDPHGTVKMPKPLDGHTWSLLQELFSAPVINPYNRTRRSL